MELNNIKENAKALVIDWLKSIFAEKVELENENLIEKGLSSIQVMQLSGKLKKMGIKISFAKLMEEPVLSKWFELIDKSKVKSYKNIESSIIKNDNSMFPLTDVQYSYLIGRENDQILGGVGCHAYLEIDGENIEEDRLKDAWNKLQYRHPMLRVKFTKDGQQVILDKPYSEEIEVFDLSGLNKEMLHSKLIEIREQKSHRKLNVNEGQVAGVALVKFADEKSKIIFDVDLLVSDVMSMSIMIKELAELYSGVELDKLDAYTFKDYMQNSIRESINEVDKEFWEQKINSFEIERPNLPLKKQPEQIKETKFTRRKKIIKKDEWETIKNIAASYQSTPSMVLLTAYALILERWCNQNKFFINIPLFNRDLENENLKDMVADFTNILLVEHETVDDARFLDTLKRINKTFLENVSHSSYSGVQVQRDISKNQGTSMNIAPVVFACNIDYPLETKISRNNLGKVSYMISQTPGVWLDFQTYIIDGDLILCWDAVDELFPKNLLDDMMDSLYELIISLTHKMNWEKKVDVLPESQKYIRKKDVDEILPLQYPNETLYDGFLKNVKLNPDKIAIIDSETKEQVTYHKLYQNSLKIADYLNKNGVEKGDYVGITLPRSSRQIYAIFGILFSGAVYVSIGITQPNDRRNKIYNQIGIKHIISDEKTVTDCRLSKNEIKIIDLDIAMANKSELEQPVNISPYDSAYIIMTSGTTGIPKGVEIMHTSAINTCIDINKKYKINDEDTILMVSAIDFDLSVYDIFGILHAGGTVVTTSEYNYRNPDEWLNLVDKYNVTIWDSVPILFDMIVTMAEGKNRKLPFRIVMLSGDWIAINLPERFYCISENVDSVIVAMGGATEASIWSNYINVPKIIPKDWISIPYGRPLKNQVYRVVDEFGRICPNYVNGELLIGGVGIAKCYHGDEELTRKKYFEKDELKWYRTGDNGKIWRDGTIEFLGRRDTQVKVRGHRIELGEIENALISFDDIKKAIALIIKDGNVNKLIGFTELIDYKENSSVSLGSDFEKLIEKYKKQDDEYTNFIDESNFKVNRVIFNVMQKCGVFSNDSYVTLEDIINKINPIDSLKNTLLSWIHNLCEEGLIKKNDNNNYCINKLGYSNEEHYKKKDIKLNEYLQVLENYLLEIIQGKINPIEFFYSNHSELSPINLSKLLPWYEDVMECIFRYIAIDIGNNHKETIILDYDSRDNLLSQRINRISNRCVHLYFDKSLNIINEVSGDCTNNNDFESLENKLDYIVAFNSIHRETNIKELMKKLKKLLNDNGKLIVVEPKERIKIQDITTSILNNFAGYDDNIFNDYEWNSIFCDINLNCTKQISIGGSIIYILEKGIKHVDTETIKVKMRNMVPAYMVPDDIVFLKNMPQNKNGKVDRNKLEEIYKSKETYGHISNTTLNGREIESLKNIWKEIFGYDTSYGTNFYSNGGDSLIATKLAAKIEEKFEISFNIKDVMENITIEAQAQVIKDRITEQYSADKISVVEENITDEEFDLTDVQHAYYIGRNKEMILGGVSTHCYFEIEANDVDVNKLEKAWNHLIRIHPMLRAIITRNGKQKILSEVQYYKIMTSADSEFITRNIMAQQVFNINEWPIFDIRISKRKNKMDIIHISFDNIILDGWSMFFVLEQWSNIYKYGKYEENINKISFREYVNYINKLKDTPKYFSDKEYWINRIEGFLKAPIISDDYKKIISKQIKFSRREAYIKPSQWNSLKKFASENNLTITSLLIGVYAEAIREVSLNENFTINITRFNRPQINGEVNTIVGDFTSLLLLEINNSKYGKMLDRFREIQSRLIDDLSHELFSGIEMQKELRKIEKDNIVLMPIVFTSGIGINSWSDDERFGKIVYGLSQTPQVFLDNQVFVYNDGLKIYWDSIDEILDEKKVNLMFEKFVTLLTEIADDSFDKESIVVKKREYTDYVFSYEDINKQEKEAIEKDILEANYIEKDMKNVWESILDISIDNYDCKFFEVGGDSLKAIQLSNKIQEVFLVNVALLEIFKNPSIREISLLVSKEKENIIEGSL